MPQYDVDIVASRFVVQAYDPTGVNPGTTAKIENKAMDEGSALLIYTLRPQMIVSVNQAQGFVRGSMQVVGKFELFHNSELYWTGFSSTVVTRQTQEFVATPPTLVNLTPKKLARDMVGAWRMKASVGILDLLLYRDVPDNKKVAFLKKVTFKKVKDINWVVVAEVHSKLNNLGQFAKKIVDNGVTYSQDDI